MTRISLGSRKPAPIQSCSSNEFNVILGLSKTIDDAVELGMLLGMPDVPHFDLLQYAIDLANDRRRFISPSLVNHVWRINEFRRDIDFAIHCDLVEEIGDMLAKEIEKLLANNRTVFQIVGVKGWVGREPILRIKVGWDRLPTFLTTVASMNSSTSSTRFYR